MTAPSQPIPLDAQPRISSRARLQTDQVSGKPVLLYPEGALILNSTGHAIVLLCDGKATVEEIAAGLAMKYGTTPSEISGQLTAFLARLRQRNLLEFQSSSTSA
jgi:pyrroloquinoline quinone biosynthesis protein D